MLAVDYLRKTSDGFGHRDVNSLESVEVFGNVEGLGEEVLDLPGTLYQQLIVIGQLIHAHASDYVPEFVLALKDSLNFTGYTIMLLANDLGA